MGAAAATRRATPRARTACSASCSGSTLCPGAQAVTASRQTTRSPELGHPVHLAAANRVVDVEAARPFVVGRERHRQQPLLAAELDLVPDVEERMPDGLASAQHPDRARLLDHEQQPARPRSVVDVDRGVEITELAQLDAPTPVADLGLRGGRRRKQHEQSK